MATLKLVGFTGELPRINPRMLPDMAAQSAVNTRLTDGALEPIRKSRRIVTIDPALPDDNATIYLYDNQWLGWPGLVHPAPGPVAADRLYYTGDGAPKIRLATSGTIYPLKVEGPTAKLSGSVSGTGDGNPETRLYVYTHVTSLGEESEPSPISDNIAWEPGQTVTLSGFQLGDAARGVDTQRIYRSQTGASGDTQLYFIAERASSTADFVDTVAVDDIVEPLPSTGWTPPPDDLQGLTAMPNGMMAGFVGKTIYFCEPYRPHAWPDRYTLTVDYEIVGLGAFGTSLAVTTKGNPYVASGSHPDSMVMQKLELNLPCLTPWGIVDLGYAVAYPSHDGLVVVSQGGAQVATEGLFSREDWQGLNPAMFSSGQYDGRYYASYVYTDKNFTERRGTLIIDLSGEQPFIIRTGIETRSFHYQIETGDLYYLLNGEVYQWDAVGEVNATQTWRSKLFVMPRPTNFGAILVETRTILSQEEQDALNDLVLTITAEREALFSSEASIGDELNGEAINEVALNDDTMPQIPAVFRQVTINVYADNTLRATISTTNRMARLPAGFKARRWEIEVVGNAKVEQIALATTGAELGSV